MTDLAQCFADLVRFETRLYNVLGERLRAEHGLSFGQYEFLTIVDRIDGCRVQDVAREIALTVGATSKATDRLEAAGWLARAPHPTDRRSSVLALTPRGRRLTTAARPTVESTLREWLGDVLPAGRLSTVARSMHQLRAGMETAGAGLPTG